MNRKTYISPLCTVYQIEPCAIFCGTGSANTQRISLLNTPIGSTPTTQDDEYVAESATYRTSLWQ